MMMSVKGILQDTKVILNQTILRNNKCSIGHCASVLILLLISILAYVRVACVCLYKEGRLS